jgi:hypothetical protein
LTVVVVEMVVLYVNLHEQDILGVVLLDGSNLVVSREAKVEMDSSVLMYQALAVTIPDGDAML